MLLIVQHESEPRTIEVLLDDQQPVFEVAGLRMRHGAVDVLTGVDFRARRGEVLASVSLASGGLRGSEVTAG